MHNWIEELKFYNLDPFDASQSTRSNIWQRNVISCIYIVYVTGVYSNIPTSIVLRVKKRKMWRFRLGKRCNPIYYASTGKQGSWYYPIALIIFCPNVELLLGFHCWFMHLFMLAWKLLRLWAMVWSAHSPILVGLPNTALHQVVPFAIDMMWEGMFIYLTFHCLE